MNRKAEAGLFISIISVSTAAIIIRSVSESISPLTISFYRLFFTVLFLLPFFIVFRKYREELFNLDKKTILLLVLIGIIISFHFATWVTSLDYTSVASSVILVTAHPILVAPVAYYFLKEKLSLFNIIGILISLFGVIILVYGNYEFGVQSINTLFGNILAILGGIFAGLYILGGRQLRKKVSVIPYAFIVYLTSTIILFFMCILSNSKIIGLPIRDYELFILMAFIAGILGHTLYNWSLKFIKASLASVALLGEPLGSTIFAFLVPWINEIPSKYTFIGGAIILFGIYLTSKKINEKI